MIQSTPSSQPHPSQPTSPVDRSQRHTRRYRKFRRAILASNPLCVQCRAEGYFEVATTIDHIQPLCQGGAMWDKSNIQPLCRACHDIKTQAELRRPLSGARQEWQNYFQQLRNSTGKPEDSNPASPFASDTEHRPIMHGVLQK